MTKIRKAVFPVGGLGTRFLPATKAMPKEMLPVVDKPLIHYAYEEAVAAGIEEFIFITGRNKAAISNHFDHSYELQRILDEKGKARELQQTKGWMPDAGSIIFTRQMEALGLGHAVWCARKLIGDEPFAVILADDLIMADTPCLKQMVDAYADTPGNVAAVIEVPKDQVSSYGILDIESEAGNVVKARGLVEKPKPEDAPSNLSITGRYILHPDIFKQLDKKQTGSGGEIQLTDAMNAMIGDVGFYGYRFDGTRFDCGNKAGFVEANVAYALKDAAMADDVRAALRKYV
ncbi:MAG: UTP--glucose-1-phosphate uridylyltransferase [Rickettsiales bacterium]|nr:UTP--glucose-1-phosphate uridylyltransferase [Rickettsiales bacterium]